MRTLSILNRLRSGETVSGKPIYVYETNAENALRTRALSVSNRVNWEFQQNGVSDHLIADGMAVIQREYLNAKHYGDNKPGSWFDIGGRQVAVTPEPRINYWKFFGYALSGGFDGYAEFSKDFGFDDQITYYIAYVSRLV